MQAKQFAIAASSNGTIGLITSATAVEHTYQENTKKQVWTGVILEDNTFQGRGDDSEKTIQAKAGGFWSSSNPNVIGYVSPEQFVDLLSADSKTKWRDISRENEAELVG